MVAAVIAECVTGEGTSHIRGNIADLCHQQQIQEKNVMIFIYALCNIQLKTVHRYM